MSTIPLLMPKSFVHLLNCVWITDLKVRLNLRNCFKATLFDSHSLLLHPFLAESNVFSGKKTGCFWTILENYERKRASSVNQSAFEIVKKHLSLPNEKSKVRAWIKIGLTKKVLTSEIREAIRVIVNIEKCYHEWAFLRSESFSTFLSAIDSLNSRVDFNFVVKEHLLNLSNKPTKWKGLVDSEGLHLEVIAPYLQLDLPDNTADVGYVQTADRTLIRQVGFLEDENVR